MEPIEESSPPQHSPHSGMSSTTSLLENIKVQLVELRQQVETAKQLSQSNNPSVPANDAAPSAQVGCADRITRSLDSLETEMRDYNRLMATLVPALTHALSNSGVKSPPQQLLAQIVAQAASRAVGGGPQSQEDSGSSTLQALSSTPNNSPLEHNRSQEQHATNRPIRRLLTSENQHAWQHAPSTPDKLQAAQADEVQGNRRGSMYPAKLVAQACLTVGIHATSSLGSSPLSSPSRLQASTSQGRWSFSATHADMPQSPTSTIHPTQVACSTPDDRCLSPQDSSSSLSSPRSRPHREATPHPGSLSRQSSHSVSLNSQGGASTRTAASTSETTRQGSVQPTRPPDTIPTREEHPVVAPSWPLTPLPEINTWAPESDAPHSPAHTAAPGNPWRQGSPVNAAASPADADHRSAVKEFWTRLSPRFPIQSAPQQVSVDFGSFTDGCSLDHDHGEDEEDEDEDATLAAEACDKADEDGGQPDNRQGQHDEDDDGDDSHEGNGGDEGGAKAGRICSLAIYRSGSGVPGAKRAGPGRRLRRRLSRRRSAAATAAATAAGTSNSAARSRFNQVVFNSSAQQFTYEKDSSDSDSYASIDESELLDSDITQLDSLDTSWSYSQLTAASEEQSKLLKSSTPASSVQGRTDSHTQQSSYWQSVLSGWAASAAKAPATDNSSRGAAAADSSSTTTNTDIPANPHPPDRQASNSSTSSSSGSSRRSSRTGDTSTSGDADERASANESGIPGWSQRTFGLLDGQQKTYPSAVETLPLVDIPLMRRPVSLTGGEYRLLVVTADKLGSGLAGSQVMLDILGVHGVLSQQLPKPKGSFQRGSQDMFRITSEYDVGQVVAVKVWHDAAGIGSVVWCLERLELENVLRGTQYTFPNPGKEGWLSKGKINAVILKPQATKLGDREALRMEVQELKSQLAQNSQLTQDERRVIMGRLEKLQTKLEDGSQAAGRASMS